MELDFYVLQMWGLVEPQLNGPYEKIEADTELEELVKKDGKGEHSYNILSVTKGAEINI